MTCKKATYLSLLHECDITPGGTAETSVEARTIRVRSGTDLTVLMTCGGVYSDRRLYHSI